MPSKSESSLVAVFGNVSEAEAAATDLVKNAFAGDHIHILSESNSPRSDDDTTEYARAGHAVQDVERWSALVFGRASKAEYQHYKKAARRGKALVGVSTPSQMVDDATEVLTRHAPLETVVAIAR